MKRASEKQLTQLSAENDEEVEEGAEGGETSGTWRSAPPDVLAQRRIVKARRPSEWADAKPNPFASAFAATAAAAAAPAVAPTSGGCTWGQSAMFAIPPMQTSKPQPPPAACDGFFAGASTCAWSTAGCGFGSVVGSAPSFSALAAAPAAAAGAGFGESAFGFGRKDAGGSKCNFSFGGAQEGKGGGNLWLGSGGVAGAAADAEEENGAEGGGDGEQEDGGADEVAIVSAPKLPLVAHLTGEEDDACVFKVRAKVFVLEQPEQQPAAPAAGGASEPASAAATEHASPAAAKSGGEPGQSGPGPAGPGESGKEGSGAKGVQAAAAASAGEATALAIPSSSRWAERGVGVLHVDMPRDAPPGPGAGSAEQARVVRSPRLVMRVENVGRLILNIALLPSLPPPCRVSETSIRVHSLGNALGEVGEDASLPPAVCQCLLRTKTSPEAEMLLQALLSSLEKHAARLAASRRV